MKIRLKVDLPIEKKYGLTKDSIWKATRNRSKSSQARIGWWVTVNGEKIGVLWREAEVVEG